MYLRTRRRSLKIYRNIISLILLTIFTSEKKKTILRGLISPHSLLAGLKKVLK